MLPIITSAVRHFIGVFIASFLANGIITGDQAEQFTNGAVAVVTVACLVGWSIIEKKFLSKRQ